MAWYSVKAKEQLYLLPLSAFNINMSAMHTSQSEMTHVFLKCHMVIDIQEI